MSPHARSQDDQQNLADLKEARAALEMADEALRKAVEGQGQGQREMFVFHVGWARGRLSRVTDRIYRPSLPANDDDAEDRGSEG
jgi:hypothetical protein